MTKIDHNTGNYVPYTYRIVGHKALCGVYKTKPTSNCYKALRSKSTRQKTFCNKCPMPKKKNQETWLIQKGSGASTMIYWEEGFREPAFVRVTRLAGLGIIRNIGQIERQFYSTEIKISYNAPQRFREFCFASVITLNDLNDLRVIEALSLKCRILAGREHAIRTSESNHCL